MVEINFFINAENKIKFIIFIIYVYIFYINHKK